MPKRSYVIPRKGIDPKLFVSVVYWPREAEEDAPTTAIRECRLHFLRAASAHARVRLSDSLNQDVFEPSRKRWAELGLPVPNVPGGQWTAEQHDVLATFDADRSRLILTWATAHNLNYDWVHEAVHDALGWEEFPRNPFGVIPAYQPPQFTWTPWYFQDETPGQYRRRIKADFKATLDAYVTEVNIQRRQFLNHRFSETIPYSWAVERVCLGWRFSEIAKRASPERTPQAVRQAILPILDRLFDPATSQATDAKNSDS